MNYLPHTSDLTSCCVALFSPPDSLRFFEDLKDMLGFTPYRFYYYMWKYITPILLLVLLATSLIQLTMTPPSYSAWIQEEVSQHLRLVVSLSGPGINGSGSSPTC